jgi:hypothetical protein
MVAALSGNLLEISMRHIQMILIASLLLALPATALADVWGLEAGETVNVTDDTSRAVALLLEQGLAEEGVTVLRARPGTSTREFFAREADAVVRYSIIGIGATTKVSVQLLDESGTADSAFSLSSNTQDDLDTICARLARSLVSGKAPREGESIYEVTEQEQQPLRQKKSNTYYGFKILGVTALTSELTRAPLKFGVGVFALYDPRFFFAELFANISGGSHEDFQEFSTEFGVAGYVPFTKSTICPYAGLGVALATRTANWSGRSTNLDGGLTGSASLGLIIGRTSDVTLRTELRYFVDTFDVDKEFSSGLMYFAAIGF